MSVDLLIAKNKFAILLKIWVCSEFEPSLEYLFVSLATF